MMARFCSMRDHMVELMLSNGSVSIDTVCVVWRSNLQVVSGVLAVNGRVVMRTIDVAMTLNKH